MSACATEITTVDGDPPSLPAREILEAPTSVTIEEAPVRIDAYLWRDFAPVVPPDRSLRVSTRVMTAASVAADLEPILMWVIQGSRVWETPVVTRRYSSGDPAWLVASAGGGPEWETGTVADVVLQLELEDGRRVLVRDIGVKIERTS